MQDQDGQNNNIRCCSISITYEVRWDPVDVMILLERQVHPNQELTAFLQISASSWRGTFVMSAVRSLVCWRQPTTLHTKINSFRSPVSRHKYRPLLTLPNYSSPNYSVTGFLYNRSVKRTPLIAVQSRLPLLPPVHPKVLERVLMLSSHVKGHSLRKGDFGNFWPPYPHVRVRKIFQTPHSLFLRKIPFRFST